MTDQQGTADLLRDLAPRALGAVVRRYGHFADAEDAVQEALLAAATTWPADGMPDSPLAWLIRVASRKMADQYRSDEARRRREELAASWSLVPAEPVPAYDDTLTLMLMCCHPALSPGAAIPLTLRAVGGLTTREIAAAFLVPEATMAQRISRAKARLKGFGEPFTLPPGGGGERLRSVLHVLYLIFNEGYAASGGPDLARTDLSGEAVRLARGVHAALPAGCRGHRPARADAADRRPAPGADRARRRTGAARSTGPCPLGPSAHHRGPDAAHRRPAPGRAGRVPATGGHRGAARPGRPAMRAPTGRGSWPCTTAWRR